jgi:uncharacterized RDD family membrane protein YckC
VALIPHLPAAVETHDASWAGTVSGSPVESMGPPSTTSFAAPYASFRDRLGAFVLDVVLVFLAVQMFDWDPEERVFLLGLLVYHVALWTWKQSTVGGIICHLRLVRVDGRRLTFPDALVRGLSSIFSLVAFGLGGLWILRDPERQAWHDKIAGTYVLKIPRIQQTLNTAADVSQPSNQE